MVTSIKNLRTLLITATLMGMVSCAAMEGRESGGQYVDDATISTRVRSSFVADPTVQATQVHVDTMQGVVELSGFVDSKAVEDRAVTLARQVDGVKAVRDQIVVR